MDAIVGVLGGVSPSSLKFNNDDDSTDKLNHRYTVVMLLIFAAVVSTKQYVGDPITCWVPAHFSGNWASYANSYCWIKSTYYLPFTEDVPKEEEDDKREDITYYQWVPLILLTQALFFYLPRQTWRTLNTRTAVDVDNIVEQAQSFEKAENSEVKDKTKDLMVRQMHRFLLSRKHYDTKCTLSITQCISKVFCPKCGRSTGNYLTLTYFFCKILFIANVIGQIFVMDAFLGSNFHLYGVDVLQNVFNGSDWKDSPRFPRVTMCDFKVRRVGNVQRYSVQCVLTINLFNEMIYLFMWFWFVFVAAVSCVSLLRWVMRMISTRDCTRFVKKHLLLMDKYNKEDEKLLKIFVNDYLKMDGVFILRLTACNADAVTVTEFVCEMWKNWRLRGLKDMEDDDDDESVA